MFEANPNACEAAFSRFFCFCPGRKAFLASTFQSPCLISTFASVKVFMSNKCFGSDHILTNAFLGPFLFYAFHSPLPIALHG